MKTAIWKLGCVALATAALVTWSNDVYAQFDWEAPDDGLPPGLEHPDPDDLAQIFDPDTSVHDLEWENLTCGRERIRRCEEMGGIVEYDPGPGCQSIYKLTRSAFHGDMELVYQQVQTAQLAMLDQSGNLVLIPPGISQEELQQLVMSSRVFDLQEAQREQIALEREQRGLMGGEMTADLDDLDLSGLVPGWGCNCRCEIWSMVDSQVTNAEKGAVALTPVTDGRGEDIVRTIMEALGQNHRHALIFLDDGFTVRHTTSSNSFDEDDMDGNNKIQSHLIENAMPGMITESVDLALATGRLGWEGLLLTHAPTFAWLFGPSFEAAADLAEATDGYYKINDYTNLNGMNLPYAAPFTSSWENSNLRGTHCSGFVDYAFEAVGLPITDFFYSASLRNDVAELLHQIIKDDIGSGLGFWKNLGASILGVKKKIANQIVNCFADKGCDNNSDDWKSGVGSAYNVSPDNLLPTAFDLQGEGCAPWGSQRICAGDHVVNPNGASLTPFTWVEPLSVAGVHWEHTVLTDW